MIVCQCNGVTDRTIRRAVRSGALSVSAVGSACGAGTCCGGCTDGIQRILRSEPQSLNALTAADPARPSS